MNPILAFILVFIIIHVGVVVAHLTLTVIVSRDIAEATGQSWLPPDELDKELMCRPLGRFILHTYPVVFWWVLTWDVIQELRHHD